MLMGLCANPEIRNEGSVSGVCAARDRRWHFSVLVLLVLCMFSYHDYSTVYFAWSAY